MTNDFEDFASEPDDGKELAKQFYQQVKEREAQLQARDQAEAYDVEPSQRKFTGRRGEIDSTGTPSAGLFSSEKGSVYAFPVEKRSNGNRSEYSSSGSSLTPRDRMLRDEINFTNAASSEVTIVLQAIVVLILLVFTVYIGSTGGITDGSDRFGALDGMINEFNGLGDSIDFSSLVSDDSAVTTVIGDVVKEGSVWL